MAANKIEIEQDLSIQFSANKKRITLQKRNGKTNAVRRVSAPISVLKLALSEREVLEEGETIPYEINWQIGVEDYAGVDYVCFHKQDSEGVRSG